MNGIEIFEKLGIDTVAPSRTVSAKKKTGKISTRVQRAMDKGRIRAEAGRKPIYWPGDVTKVRVRSVYAT
jgi:hypothetical protein